MLVLVSEKLHYYRMYTPRLGMSLYIYICVVQTDTVQQACSRGCAAAEFLAAQHAGGAVHFSISSPLQYKFV